MNLADSGYGRQFRLKGRLAIPSIFICLALILCLPPISVGAGEMSDEQKKEVVYRMYAGYKKYFPTVEDISPRQAMALMNLGAVVFVDTRKPEEMAVSILPGAVTKEYFLNHREGYADKTVVVYCTISYRSGLFADSVAKEGIRVLNLQGGILAWILEGGVVTDPSGKEVKRIHVYGEKWNYPAAGYESVIFGWWRQML